jgi:hypothetical protein
MTILSLLGGAGLFLFAIHVWKAGVKSTEPPGLTVRSEILTIYAPMTLIDFARAHPEIGTNEELLHLIREAKLKVWFAEVVRNYQASGRFDDILFTDRPGERPESLERTKSVLLTLSDNPPCSDTVDYKKARIVVLDAAMMDVEPMEGLRGLLMRDELEPFADRSGPFDIYRPRPASAEGDGEPKTGHSKGRSARGLAPSERPGP